MVLNPGSGVLEIDGIMKLGMAHPMGPLELADFIGLDVCRSILEVMHDGFKNPKYAPNPLLVNMVRAGKLGKKTGEGFYNYADEKKAVAYHEAGHATVSWMLEHAAPLVKVTIVPRGQSLGAAWYLPEERLIVRPEQMLDEMCAALGGRAAEKVIFNKISTGALSDLEKVTKQARAMVTVYGLNDKVGNLTYYDSSNGNDYGFTKPYSERTAETIDKEISSIIEKQYQRAIKLLEDNKSKLIELAEVLLDKEVIFKDNLEKIFGSRPFDKEVINS